MAADDDKPDGEHPDPQDIEIYRKPEPKRRDADRPARFWAEYAEKGFDPLERYKAAEAAGYPISNLQGGVRDAVKWASENQKFQDALKKEGVDYTFLAKTLKRNLEAKKPFFDPSVKETRDVDDHGSQLKAFELASKIADLFPSQKIDISQSNQQIIQITVETVNRGMKAAQAEVVPIDAIESDYIE